MNEDEGHGRTATEAALWQAQQDQKLMALGLLAAAVAHDFNNLLTAILGHASILDDTLPPEHPERTSIEEIIVSSQQAAGLARQLLSFTKSSPADRTPVDLNEIARDTYSLLRRLIGVDVRLHLDLDPAPREVSADPVQLAQVLMNLILNARDALPGERGQIWVRTGRTFGAAPSSGPLAVIEVEDDGVGMSEAVQARLFEPFFSTKPERRGTGLGMAIVHSIVERHGGRIHVESETGRGTRIRIFLPLAA